MRKSVTENVRNKQRTMHNYVPSDVLIDILVRLSVKSLCRLKYVSKLWCSLISDPRFAKRHADLAMIDKDVKHERQKLLLVAEEGGIEHDGWKSLYHVECEALTSYDVKVAKLNLPSTIRTSIAMVKFIGTFNGLLCLYLGEGSILLLNPATKELKRVPNSCIDVDGYRTNYYFSRSSIYGFGYHHSADDYNVVEINSDSIVSVYSMKANTWRRAQSFSYHSLTSDPGVPLNGAIHWVFSRGEEDELASRQRSIVAFNLAKGKFRELPRPPNVTNNNVAGLGVLGGCVCWLTHSITVAAEQQCIWVMKEYGVKESWTKVFAIGMPNFWKMKPLGYLKKDEVLLDINGRLEVYNPREGTPSEILIPGIRYKRLQAMQTYVESLISPNLC